MPRRLPLRRHRRRHAARRRPPRRIRQAHRLLERGKHREAALLFHELARAAEDLHLGRAPFLYLQAGRAWVLSNEPEAGLKELTLAVDKLAENVEPRRFRAILIRTLAELERLGHHELAQQLRNRLDLEVGNVPEQGALGSGGSPLPAKCAQCGASLHPEEVEELSDGSAVCAYCSSRIVPSGGAV